MTSIPAIAYGAPNYFEIFSVAFLLVIGALVFYALRSKGYVRAEFSHGKTTLRLEAKDRPSANYRRR